MRVSLEKKRSAQKRDSNWRVRVVFSVITVGFMVIGIRLYMLQVSAYDLYSSFAENQHTAFHTLQAKRGEIFLRDGKDRYPIAVNKNYPMVFVSPREVKDKNAVILGLSKVLSMSSEEIEQHFDDMNDPFEVIAKKVTEEQAKSLQDMRLSGVYNVDETYRFYPSDRMASQVVGFVGSDEKTIRGRYGIESYWEDTLRGADGAIRQSRDSGGRWIAIADRELIPAQDGANIILTLDKSVQYKVERILQETVEMHQAKSGSILVMEPKTGKILAMASYPDFNPNEYGITEDIANFMNPSVNLAYESGSVFKPFTLAMGIDMKKISPETIYTDTGEVHSSGYVIKNSDGKSHGIQTMTNVLEESLNTGTVFVQQAVGNKDFSDYVHRFGFGEKSGIELPGEISGNIRNLDFLKRDINFYTASFGQGISVTPIQLANAYSVLANGGNLMKPHIVDRIEYPDGSLKIIEPEVVRKVIQESTSEAIKNMLRSVVVNGHGKKADVPGYLVAGKTGTAQVAKSESKGYEDAMNIGSFAGFAPLDDPQFVVLVKIDNPKDVQWAESSAAPAFRDVMSFLLEHFKIEPTEEYSVRQLQKR